MGGVSTGSRNRGKAGRGGHLLVLPEMGVARPALRLSTARHGPSA
jgi:alpha-D-ribose 1-methylphosphonate 5-triphosphate synthase subunit PhnG